jgi:hypothetical protein
MRIFLVLVVACGFGVAESLFKGDYVGLRGGIGNLAAPWIVLPMACAAVAAPGRLGHGAAIGLITTLAALLGFYLANAYLLNLGPHSSLHDVAYMLETNSVWFKAGVISGPVTGALGSWLIRRGRFALAAVGAAVVVCEPFVVYLYLHLRLGAVIAPGGSDWRAAYVLEAVAGVIAAAALWRVHGRRQR